MNITRPTIMEIDVNAFMNNVTKIQEFVGNKVKLMPVIKANAYGTYINTSNELINKFDIVAVAIADEAIELRNQGYEKEIFILNQPAIQEIEKITKYNITIGVCERNFIKVLGKIKENIKIHIEIDSGMGRTGIKLEEIEKFLEEVSIYKNIKVDGIYTHLSSADFDFDYTEKQIEIFENATKQITNKIKNVTYIHCAASNGILNFEKSKYNLVRPGLILYGYEPFDNALSNIGLKPIAKLKSKITFLKEVEKGTSIGYSRKFITEKKSKIATIPIGYADGLNRLASNNGYVVINNKKAPILGNICMDSIMVDVTEIENVHINTDVYIWDNEIIKLEDIANNCNTINYEIISTISSRVPRVFVKI